jgi:hypothetical protein
MRSRRRIDILEILRDGGRREQMFVRLIMAMQAREGIITSEDQARQAYRKVREEKMQGFRQYLAAPHLN